ncbi:hypothetical protein FVR03_13025 [Pontibacter qinzhouensis]|uniref:Uncharacterized protein n=1 Tax=Pontibacter qinzhouensis TaxID=2603253 RepID=A0A5C8K5A9_9BACT|nr:hypothetical protein [Pontibacter qinzhouensis]TXK44873.1 hypothetical protein FVR03_13025 [Pontibacter qinzhouensis]
MKQWFGLYQNILTLFFKSSFYQLPESAKNAVSPTQWWLRLLKIAGYTLLRLIGNLFKRVEEPTALTGKVWLYVVSQNNCDSLKFIAQAMPEAVLVAGQSKELGTYNGLAQRLSLRRKVLYYYKFFPLLLLFLFRKPNITLRFFDVLYDAVGFYEVYLQKLQKYKPRCVVFANDHNPDARAMLLAAKKLSIQTIYIQHASVSPNFPPLQFDLSLLEGQDSWEKYKQCGPITGKVELVGMPKADAFVPFRNHNKSIGTIGIGSNLMDNTEELEQLVKSITMRFQQVQVIVRPHPRDTRNFASLQLLSPQVSLSSARTESTFDYLRRIDVQISANSGIHLEAVLLNVWSIFFNLNQEEQLHDYYGFIEKGLVESATNTNELLLLLQQHLTNKPDVYLRAKYFNATVATAYDGKSSELALKYIKDFILPD